MSESIYLIYKHTSPSGKSYIGQTSDIKYRNWRHQRDDSGCVAFRNAIKKYGWDSFIHEILAENLTVDEANQLEEQYILEHNTLFPDGYNLYKGGLNRSPSEETRQKISAARTGKPRSEETKRKISEYQKGRPKSPEAVEKSRQAKIGKPCSDEKKQKIRESLQKTREAKKASLLPN